MIRVGWYERLMGHPKNNAASKPTPPASPTIQVWTDGSCLLNPGGPGGWAAILVRDDGSREEIVGGAPDTTNNRMELMGPISALERIGPTVVRVISDAQYVVRGASEWMRNWKKRGWRLKNGDPIKNEDLWRRMDSAIARHDRVLWQWVRGHSGDVNNEAADQLAETEARKYPHDPEKVRAREELIERTRAPRRESYEAQRIRELEDELTPGLFRRWS